ncbi:MAG: helix-turn-helix transcriptional regulator [Ruminococcus sp.]|nr:helix-turn-helix transcriptional regulator [Ruminococcus sp.]
MTLADNIRNARQTENLSQGELAEMLGVHQTYVSMIERGINVPSLEQVERMADIFSCSVDWLLGRDEKYISRKEN